MVKALYWAPRWQESPKPHSHLKNEKMKKAHRKQNYQNQFDWDIFTKDLAVTHSYE